jgi:hypothetical protein
LLCAKFGFLAAVPGHIDSAILTKDSGSARTAALIGCPRPMRLHSIVTPLRSTARPGIMGTSGPGPLELVDYRAGRVGKVLGVVGFHLKALVLKASSGCGR